MSRKNFEQLSRRNKRIIEIAPDRVVQISLQLGNAAMAFHRIQRVPRYDDGERENDAEHSFMLALIAPELATALKLDLDAGLISQFATVHDLVELRTGDVATFSLTAIELAKKEAAEMQALHGLLRELPPHTAAMLARYELQDEPEARFVRAVDKLLPLVIDAIGDGLRVMQEDYGVETIDDLRLSHDMLHRRIADKYGPEFPGIKLAHAMLCELFETVFESQKNEERLGQNVEVERKFAIDLSSVPSDIPVITAQRITQVYTAINRDGTEERMRKIDNLFDQKSTYVRTEKATGDLLRGEHNELIDEAVYTSEVAGRIVGMPVNKDRIVVATDGPEVIELDIYKDQLTGLAVAEVEFSGVDNEAALEVAGRFVPPSWFGAEITEDTRYKNKNLALYGAPTAD